MGNDMIQLSRTVSHALRHVPWQYELEVDDKGWTSVEHLLMALRTERKEWRELSEDDLVYMIEVSAKRRHEIQDGRIRALYGHSISGKLKKKPATPPELLFHGTNPDAVSQITSSGILPMKRQYVHLSTDRATAEQVGKRKSKDPAILRVLALQAHSHGVRFYEGNDQVWLADEIPSEFIKLDDLACDPVWFKN